MNDIDFLSLGGVRVDRTDTGKFPPTALDWAEERIFDPSYDCDAVQVLIKAGTCHDNALLLWHDVSEMEVWTGFALDKDGIWVNHTWGCCFGMVIETTVPFSKYVGRQVKKDFLLAQTQEAAQHKDRLGIPADLKGLLWSKTHRVCKKCGLEQLINQFRANSTGWRRNDCLACGRKATSEYQKANPEKANESAKRYYARHPEKRRAIKRAWYAANPERYKGIQRRHSYGIEPEQYDRMLLAQANKCAICALDFTKSDRVTTPHVDHNHTTGAVRGLLCGNCNSGIGKLMDSPDIVSHALDYLRRFS